jgi:hypothetical protein
MIRQKFILRNNLLATVLVSSLVITLILAAGVVPGHAQERRSVQELTQRIEAGDVHYYQLPDLNAGETLSIYVMGTSGNFDPFAALVDGGVEPSVLEKSFFAEIAQAVANGEDPFVVLPQIASYLWGLQTPDRDQCARGSDR